VLTARPAVAALERRGIDPGPALRTAGVSREALESIDTRLPLGAMGALWEAASELSEDPSFGIHVAEELPDGAYDLFEYLLSTAATVGEGFARLAPYVRLLHDDAELRLVVEPRYARLVFSRGPAARPQQAEFSVALCLLRSRRFSGVEWRPERVTFRHERRRDDGEPKRLFGCPVLLRQPQTELRFPSSVLALRHVRADSVLLSIITRYADSLLTALPPRGALAARVSSSIARQIAHGPPTLKKTARDVRVPERTLQRQLAKEGNSHSMLVDEVRRGLAMKYLAHAGISVGEIAFLLHLSPSAFHRSFKRWTRETPLVYRRQLFPPPAPVERAPPR
jgi:AraC-like DNA-binding protein